MENFRCSRDAVVSKKWCPPYTIPQELENVYEKTDAVKVGSNEVIQIIDANIDSYHHDSRSIELVKNNENEHISLLEMLMPIHSDENPCANRHIENDRTQETVDCLFHTDLAVHESCFYGNEEGLMFGKTSVDQMQIRVGQSNSEHELDDTKNLPAILSTSTEQIQFFNSDYPLPATNHEILSKSNGNFHDVSAKSLNVEDFSSACLNIPNIDHDWLSGTVGTESSGNACESVNMFEAFSVALGLDLEEQKYAQNTIDELINSKLADSRNETFAQKDITSANNQNIQAKVKCRDSIKSADEKHSQKMKMTCKINERATTDIEIKVFPAVTKKCPTVTDFKREMKPFIQHKNQAAKRNNLRHGQQFSTKETYNFVGFSMKKKKGKAAKKVEILETLKTAYDVTGITMSIVEVLHFNKTIAEISTLLGKLSKLQLTARCQLFAPYFIMAISECKNNKCFPKEIRRLAEACYKHCKSMFVIPSDTTFESILAEKISKIRSSSSYSILERLKGFVNESFDSENSNESS